MVDLFNYQNNQLVPATPGVEYTLHILLPDGKDIHCPNVYAARHHHRRPQWWSGALKSTPLPGDYLLQRRSGGGQLLPAAAELPALEEPAGPDFLFTDRLNVTPLIAFGTNYNLTEGDTVFNTIFNITKEYYDYCESIQLAVLGSANPFTQPSPIKSNVSGTADPLGIFTCLVYDQELTRVQR